MQLKDQAAIVTGGASGLGAATARRLAAQGAKVAVCDLNEKLAESLIEDCEELQKMLISSLKTARKQA